MNTTRREFLRQGIGTSSVLACGNALPYFLAESAAAFDSADRPERILVVLELDGGNDGLNTVVPYNDDIYRKNRPKLQVPASDVLRIDDSVGFHPNLQSFANLLEAEELAIVQSVGYPNPSRSHFRSMSIWQTGDLDATRSTPGWLSHYVDAHSKPGQHDSVAMHVGDANLPQGLAGSNFQVPTATRLEQLTRRIGVPDDANPPQQLAALDRIIGQPRGPAAEDAAEEAGSHLRFLQQSASVSFASSARLREILLAARARAASYPGYGLAERLRMIAQLIKAELKTSIYYTSLGGFDTHGNQRFQHANLLTQLGASIRAFFADLHEAGLASRVLLLVFSEFGRRLRENAGAGTDHGTAGPVFLAGPAVRAGIHGPYPNLADLHDGDPKFAIDFRQVYATLLEEWLHFPQRQVLTHNFARLPILQS